MSLKEEIDREFKISYKNRQKEEISILRLLKSEIKNKEIEIQKDLEDSDIIKIIKSMVKKSNDAISQYQDAGRNDLKEKEENEKKILSRFLPPQLSENEIESIVKDIIKGFETVTQKDFGKIMKEAMAKTSGNADGKTVKSIVQKLLN